MKKISAYCWQDGPFSLPDMGKGKFNSEDSDVVERATLIRPAVVPTSIRAWPQRVLLLHGKDGCTQVDFDRARSLATELVIRNQQIYAAQEVQQHAQQAQQALQGQLYTAQELPQPSTTTFTPQPLTTPPPRPSLSPARRGSHDDSDSIALMSPAEEISSDSSVPPPVQKKAKRFIAHIQIYTFGIESMGLQYDATYDVIHRRVKDLYQIDLGMLVDCRKPFKYPRCARRHNGHHDEFVRNLVDNPEFSGWLYNVKQDLLWQSRRWCSDSMTSISSSRNTSAELFHIGVFCKGGNKRSVGCSLILQSIFKRHGFFVKPVLHRSEANWPRRKICSSSCATCQNGNSASPLKRKALLDAFKIWKGL